MVGQRGVLADPAADVGVGLDGGAGGVLGDDDAAQAGHVARATERLHGEVKVGGGEEPVGADEGPDTRVGAGDGDVAAGLGRQHDGANGHVVVGWERGGGEGSQCEGDVFDFGEVGGEGGECGECAGG